ncbi:MAG TPA: ATP-binding protein [Pyrinomonadaceae bacterium]|nr:ATP-binding protein [Pyrinomonadaceae bacterium]
MSELEDKLQQINAALEDLRAARNDGPRTRQQLDSLFRRVHNLKAEASVDGLTDLSDAAHKLEDVLHALRTGTSTLDHNVLQQLTTALSNNLPTGAIPDEIWRSLKTEEKHSLTQCVKEGANLFLVQTIFDVAGFDRQFQNLKEKLSSGGEVISIAPRVESEHVNFRIVYANAAEAGQVLHELNGIPGVTVQQLLHQRIDSFAAALHRAMRAGQSAALTTGKEVDFIVRGEELLLDSSLCEAMADPLVHLVRNAVDHGIEGRDERVRLGKHPRGRIVIAAATDDGETIITVTDDGRGIDPAVVDQVFLPGFSTASEVTAISGRGVGLDAVETSVKELGGSVSVTSEPGQGSTFAIRLPHTPKP